MSELVEAVRPLAPSDADACAALESQLRDSLIEARGGPEWLAENPVVGAAGWPGVTADDALDAWVATLDDVIVGISLAQSVDRRLVVRMLYVEPDARELGLGDMLLMAALDRARERGCERLESVALPGDRETKNLFERFGVKARLLVVSRRLDA